MAKQKKSTESPLKGLENVFDKLIARLPDNINVDAAKLTQMGLGGVAGYYLAEDMIKQAVVAYAQFGSMTEVPGAGGVSLGGVFGVFGVLVELLLTGGELGITDEEKQSIKDFKLTEEQRIAFACGIAALTPMVPEIVKGVGEIAKGIGEVVPG